MRIAVTATGPDLEAKVDPRFGRCPYFLIVETDEVGFEAIENPNTARGGGAGIQSAHLVAEHGVKCVLTGNCGPNAHRTLSAAGIAVFVGCCGVVREVIEQYKAGRLSPVAQPNVAGHFGMAAPSAGSAETARGTGLGLSGGMGRGRGRGGRGGRGQGMGGGSIPGQRRNTGGQGFPGARPPAPTETDGEDALALLRQHAEALKQQTRQIEQRIAELEQEKRNG